MERKCRGRRGSCTSKSSRRRCSSSIRARARDKSFLTLHARYSCVNMRPVVKCICQDHAILLRVPGFWQHGALSWGSSSGGPWALSQTLTSPTVFSAGAQLRG